MEGSKLPPKDRKFDFSIQYKLDKDKPHAFLQFYKLKGKDLIKRTHSFKINTKSHQANETWVYGKASLSSPLNVCKGIDEYGNIFEGPNFASADYMGLQHHPESVKVI